MKKITLLLTFLIAFGYSNYAQVSAYGFTHSLGAYTENSPTATTVPGALADSYISGVLPIGFNFSYDGSVYTQFKMSSNGVISFNTTGTSNLTGNDFSPANATSRPIIAPLWDDLDGRATGSNASYELIGTSPNQVLTVEWRNWEWNYNSGSTPVISFQVKLYETTNVIEFVYRQDAGPVSSGSASIGIGSATGSGAGSYLSVSNVTTPAVSSTTSSNSLNTKPATGQVFTFTPPAACTGAPVAGTISPASQTLAIGQASAALTASGYSSGVSSLAFQWEESTDNATWANAVGGTGATTASYTPPAFSGTPIYYRLVVTCTPSALSDTTASVLLTGCSVVTDFAQNFDSVTTPAFPVCWTKVGSSGTASTQTSSSNSSPNTLYMYGSSGTNQPVVSMVPVSNLGSGTHRLTFNMRANFSTNGVVEFGYLVNPADATTFVSLGTATAASTTYAPYVITPAAGTYSNYPAFRHTGTPANSLLIDDVTWEAIPVTPPTCASNIVATPNASCGNFSNSITWDATTGADGYYVTVGTSTGATNIANAVNATGTSYSFTGTAGTTYFYTIVPYNVNGPATGCTESTFSTVATGCYCVSTPTSVDGDGIINVQVGTTDFPNTVTTSPVYNDHTATIVDMTQGINNNVQVTFDVTSFGTSSYDYHTVIWIDSNDDYTFDASEIVFTGVSAMTAAPTALNASFILPGATPLGQHRMRIVATDVEQLPSNPCYSGTYGETADFTINVIAASCAPVTFTTTTIVPDCANSQFSIAIDVTGLGDGTPVFSDGTSTWPITAIGVNTVGPFANEASVNLSIIHGSDTTCDLTLGAFTYTCPPANDECDNAIGLTVNADLACGVVTPGSNVNATDSGLEPTFSVSGTPDNDVWFSFTATGTAHVITLTNVTSVIGTSTDMAMALFDGTGTCAALTLVGSSDPNSYFASGLTAGTTYYLSVYGYSTAQTTFDVCVGTPPPAPANDECTGAIGLSVNPDYTNALFASGTIASATASSIDETACFGTEDDDVWYSFVAIATTHRVSLFNVTNGTTDLYHSLWTGADCNSLTLVAGSCSDPNISNPTGLVVGQTYYVRVYSWSSTSGQTSMFDISIGTDSALSTDTFDNASFSAYPNPVKDILNLEYSSEISSVKIINLLGQEVISRKVNNTSSQIDMSSLTAGAYIVNVTIGDVVKTIKVIKQ